MKRLCIVALLACCTLVLANPPAHAFGIMGSWWNMKDTEVDGWGGGIRQEIGLLPKDAEDAAVHLSIDTRASYIRFSADDPNPDLNVIPLEVGVLLGFGILYAEVGGGYYIVDSDVDAQNNWGWFALAGVMLGKGAKGLFGELKYTGLSTDIDNVDPDFDDIPTSIDADGVGINVGISFGI